METKPTPVPVLARVGMTARTCTDDGGVCGPIVSMTDDHCVLRIARTDSTGAVGQDSTVGRLVARSWSEVELADVRPDPHPVAAEPTPKEAPRKWPRLGELWTLYEPHGIGPWGYLVTEFRDPTTDLRALLRCRTNNLEHERQMEDKALAVAADGIDPEDRDVLCISRYAKIDSTLPTPIILYGKLIAPWGEGHETAAPYNPFCRFRMVAALRTHARLAWPDKGSEEFPFFTAGIDSKDDGGHCIEYDAAGDVIRRTGEEAVNG